MRVPGNGLNGPSLQLGIREVAKKAVVLIAVIQVMELLTEVQTITIKVSYAGPAIIK